jgi:hypothetical protein
VSRMTIGTWPTRSSMLSCIHSRGQGEDDDASSRYAEAKRFLVRPWPMWDGAPRPTLGCGGLLLSFPFFSFLVCIQFYFECFKMYNICKNYAEKLYGIWFGIE